MIDFVVPAMLEPLSALSIGGERIGVVEIDDGGANAGGAGKVYAELLDEIALDFGDRYLEHDLVTTANDDRVEHLGAVADGVRRSRIHKPCCNIEGLLRLRLARHKSRQNHAVGTDAFNADLGLRQDLFDCGADTVEAARYRNVEADHLLAFGVEEKHVGLADLDADDVGTPRGADDGIRDLWIGDKNVLDIARKVDHHGFSDAKRDGARPVITRGNSDRLHLRFKLRSADRAGRRQPTDDAGRKTRHKRRKSRRSDRCRSYHINFLRAVQCALACVLTP